MIFKTNISRNQNYKPTVYVYQEIYTCKKKTVTSVREATVNNLNMLNENVFPFFSISQNKGENVCETEVTIHRSLVVERPTGGLAKNPPFSCRVYSRQAHNPGQKSRGFLGPSLSIIHICCTGSPGLDNKRCTVYCLLNIINIPKETLWFF